MKRTLTDKQVEEAYTLYNEGKSSVKLAEIFHCCRFTILREFRKAKLPIRSISEATQKYAKNKHVFDCIDTEEKAYWLGFLYADGNVSKTNRIRLSLAEQDYSTLEKFSNFIYSKNRIKHYVQRKYLHRQNLIYVDVGSKYMSEKLTNLGCTPNKTFLLTFPDWIDKNLINHFIRGYFDGDGCLSIYIGKNGSGNKCKKQVLPSYQQKNF